MDDQEAPLAHIELDSQTYQRVHDYAAAMLRRWARVGLHVDVSSASVRIGTGAVLEALGLVHPDDRTRSLAVPAEEILARVDEAARGLEEPDADEEPDIDVEGLTLEERKEVAKEFIGVAVEPSGTFTARYASTPLGTYRDPVEAAKVRDAAAREAGQPERRMNFPRARVAS